MKIRFLCTTIPKFNITNFSLFTVSEKISLFHPLDRTVSKRSSYGNPLALIVGETYSISEETPLMPEFAPSDPMKALENVKTIPAGNLIKIASIREKDNNPWYEVQVLNISNDLIGKGWINSKALMKQSLRIKDKPENED